MKSWHRRNLFAVLYLNCLGSTPKRWSWHDGYPSELKTMIVAIEKRLPRIERLPCIAKKRWSKVSVSSLQKVQISLSLIVILYKKEFAGRRLWRNLNRKIFILVLFVHFFPNLFLPHRAWNLCTILFKKLAVFHSLLQRDFYTSITYL